MTETAYEVIKIDEGSWRIEDGMVRSFLFEGTDDALLIDTGFGSGNIREVVEGLTEKPVMLVNSHADEDHVGCNKLFGRVHMHPSEYAFYFESNPADSPVAPLWEGQVIDLKTRKFEVILIPGHTPGSIALLDRKNRILISGDTITDTPIFMFGKMRSVRAYIESLEKLSGLNDCFDKVYASHGSFPIGKDSIPKLIAGAEKLLRGELKAEDPPFEIPAKMYTGEGASFFF